MELEDELFVEDDIDVLDIIDFGFPRQIYNRSNYFETMDDMSFYRRFRLTKPVVFRLLEEIEDALEFPEDKCVSNNDKLARQCLSFCFLETIVLLRSIKC